MTAPDDDDIELLWVGVSEHREGSDLDEGIAKDAAELMPKI
jgi:hypothetical protein